MDRPVSETAYAPASKLPAQLPPLREELQLHAAAPYSDGSPAWVIQDPVNNRFYRIGWLEFELLSRWSLASAESVLSATASETLLSPQADELEALYAFLLQNQLLTIHEISHTRELVARFRASTQNRLTWLLHHYLFFRIPIFHPADLLQAAKPWTNWIFSRFMALTVTALSLLGLILTARQWDVFVSSFVDTLSPGGLLAYMLALAVTKSLSSLGTQSQQPVTGCASRTWASRFLSCGPCFIPIPAKAGACRITANVYALPPPASSRNWRWPASPPSPGI